MYADASFTGLNGMAPGSTGSTYGSQVLLIFFLRVSCLSLTLILICVNAILFQATKNINWIISVLWVVLNLHVSVDGCDELRPAGPTTLPRTGAGWAALSAAALHPHICGSSTQTPATATFRGLPEVHRRTECRVLYCQQMGPNTLWWVRRQINIML